MTNETTQAQWNLACQTLNEEFQIQANDLPTMEAANALFLQLVGRRSLTQETVNALMYSLYFSSYLNMLSAFKQQSPGYEVPEYLHAHPVLEASNRWAQQATDGYVLQQLAQPIITETQTLLDQLN